MNLPLVSVIIPTYNREKTIKRAIESVLNQTYHNIECIVVDDCSIDSTESIINDMDDSRLKYIKQSENGGACVARNRGIEEASGEYVAFQDSDDEFFSEKIELQLHVLTENDADVVFCAMKRHGYNCNDKMPYSKGFVNIHSLLMAGMFSTQTVLLKAEIAKKFLFDVNMKNWKEDYELGIRLSSSGYKIYFIDIPLVNVYLSSDSLTKQRTYEKDIYVSNLLLEKYDRLAQEFQDWQIKLLNNIAYSKTMMGENANEIYKEIYEKDRTIANKLKYFLSKIHLLKLYYKLFN